MFVRVTLKSGQPRGQIPCNEFEGLWNTTKDLSSETRFVNIGGQLETYKKQDGGDGKTVHVSYIIVLIDHIVKKQIMK